MEISAVGGAHKCDSGITWRCAALVYAHTHTRASVPTEMSAGAPVNTKLIIVILCRISDFICAPGLNSWNVYLLSERKHLPHHRRPDNEFCGARASAHKSAALLLCVKRCKVWQCINELNAWRSRFLWRSGKSVARSAQQQQ